MRIDCSIYAYIQISKGGWALTWEQMEDEF